MIEKKQKILRFLKSNWGFPVAILCALAFRSTFASQYNVPTGSMIPTIQIGDHIFANKMAYDLRIPFTTRSLIRISEPKRGEVIVFANPRDPSGIPLVKRLIGLPGDRLEIIDGWIWINGKALPIKEGEKPLLFEETMGSIAHQVQRIPSQMRPEHLGFVVPEGHYFFMGDNRDNSADSRVWGFVPRNLLLGQAKWILYTLNWESWKPDFNTERSFKTL